MAPRRRKPAEGDGDDDEEEEVDELEAAEQSLRRASKKSKSSDKGKGKSKGKGKQRERRRGDDEEEEEEEEDGEAVDPDEEGNGNAGRARKAKAKAFTEGDISEKARELVRFALCNEGSKKLLKREDINKKVMGPGQARNLDAILQKANKYLRKTFGMQLVPLYPREIEDDDDADGGANDNDAEEGAEGEEEASGDDDDEDDDDEERRRKKKKKKAAAARKRAAAAAANAKGKGKGKGKGAGASSGPAKSFALRTLLSDELVRAAVEPAAFEPEMDARNVGDLRAALGDGGMKKQEWAEWKMTRDEIVDWQTGPEQRTLMGILHIILALIMVNERVLTDEQLTNHLKRIDLRLDTPLPLGPSAIRADKQTLSTFLSTLSKQGYLDKTKLANPVAAAAGKGRATQTQTQTQATQAQTQRGRQTQQRNDNDDAADGAAGGGSGGGQSGNPNEEWRWGPRAYAEVGEKSMAEFIKDFYVNLAGAGAGGRGGGRGTQGAGVGVGGKDRAKLEKEIIKGTTGGKQGAVLQVAREARQNE